MRINKYIALALGVARRKADELVMEKQIYIDGKIAVMGQDVGDTMVVTMLKDGVQNTLSMKSHSPKILLWYKPAKIVTSHVPEGGNKTLYDLLPSAYKDYKFAGRLDVMSEGLLVLSNDGGVVNTLTHPRFGHTKTYLVVTERLLKPFEIDTLSRGVEIDGYQTKPAKIELFSHNPKAFKQFAFLGIHIHQPAYLITLSEGRNQQIRKMMFAVRTKVKRLIRVRFGDYVLDASLFKGAVKEMSWKGVSAPKQLKSNAKTFAKSVQKPHTSRFGPPSRNRKKGRS